MRIRGKLFGGGTAIPRGEWAEDGGSAAKTISPNSHKRACLQEDGRLCDLIGLIFITNTFEINGKYYVVGAGGGGGVGYGGGGEPGK